MSALNLRTVKREFSQLNYRPDACHPSLIHELKIILEITGKLIVQFIIIILVNNFCLPYINNFSGLSQEYGAVLNNITTHSLSNVIRHVIFELT